MLSAVPNCLNPPHPRAVMLEVMTSHCDNWFFVFQNHGCVCARLTRNCVPRTQSSTSRCVGAIACDLHPTCSTHAPTKAMVGLASVGTGPLQSHAPVCRGPPTTRVESARARTQMQKQRAPQIAAKQQSQHPALSLCWQARPTSVISHPRSTAHPTWKRERPHLVQHRQAQALGVTRSHPHVVRRRQTWARPRSAPWLSSLPRTALEGGLSKRRRRHSHARSCGCVRQVIRSTAARLPWG